jgi:hypothetical protein
MAEIGRENREGKVAQEASERRASTYMHPAWARLMRYCVELGHGEIEKLKIQDGVPVIADVVREKVKFT